MFAISAVCLGADKWIQQGPGGGLSLFNAHVLVTHWFISAIVLIISAIVLIISVIVLIISAIVLIISAIVLNVILIIFAIVLIFPP
jgi:hypothetical protein